LNEGERVVTGVDLAGEKKEETCKCKSESGVIDDKEITSFVTMKVWVAAEIVCLEAPVNL
jgi:hypothetical protein